MTATRSRKQEQNYKKYLQARGDDTSCQFCSITTGDDQFVSDTPNFKIIRNIFSYSIWDNQRVSDHLMVVPKLHTDTLKDIKPRAAKEFIDLISNYEQRGYNIYARAPSSNMKSVIHQHTHLIKLDGKRLKVMFHLRKPYVRITR